MANELERRMQAGDKESIEKHFNEILLSFRGVQMPTVKKLNHLIFLTQVKNYILEEVKG